MARASRRERPEARNNLDRPGGRLGARAMRPDAGAGAGDRDRRRRVVTGITVVVLTLVLVGVAVATVAATRSGTGSGSKSNVGSAAPVLTTHTLLRLPAASAVATGATARVGYATDDQRDLAVRFDPRDGRVLASGGLPDRPAAMIRVGPDLWVAEAGQNTVVEVDADSLHIVRTVPVPAGPAGLALFREQVWVVSTLAGEVTPVDPGSGTVGTPVDIPGGAVRMAAGLGALWVTGTGDTVHHFVPPSRQNPEPVLEAITVGRGPIGVATGAGSVWVTNAQGGTVSQIDPATLRVVHTYDVGGDPSSVTVARGRVFVGDGAAQTVHTVFPAPGSKMLDIGTTPRQLLPVGDAVWVAGANPGRVLAVSPS